MSNILDYLDWRGDLDLTQSPFNEVDNLLLAELSFLDLEGIVPAVGVADSISLREAIERYLLQREGMTIHMGVLVPDEIPVMAAKMAESRRFGDMRLDGFRTCLDVRQEIQFAAMTVDLGDGSIYISFRGTDDTLVGWKEDFNMAFLDTVPSQRLAVEYVREMAAIYPEREIRIGGHSKGGNLTVYSAVHCGAEIQSRLICAYNNDGPGFKRPMSEVSAYHAVRERIVTIIPESSVVGMLLEHDENYTVVRSNERGLYQHDGFSWEVLGTAFVHLQEVSEESLVSDKAIRAVIGEMDDAQREMFVDALFDVLGSSDAQTLTEMESDRSKTVSAMVKSYTELSKEARQTLSRALRTLFRHGAESLVDGLEIKSEEIKKLLKIKK